VPARVYLVTPGFEGALAAELAGTFAERRTLVAGVVATEDRDDEAARALDPVFARQVLPGAVEVSGASVRALAEAAYAAVEGIIDAWDGPWTLHAFGPPVPADADAPEALPGARGAHTRALAARRERRDEGAPARARASDGGLARRAALVGQELLALLGQRRRRATRRHVADLPVEAFDDHHVVVQVLALDRERAVVSAATPHPFVRGGYDLAPWPGGAAPVAEDRAPPSRAYRKLEEAFQWMERAPRLDETCVDLGAAPGGWTYVAARRGARVLAVDRSPLAPNVARFAGVSTTEGNAFTYVPPSPVDWLLSDIVCEPQRAIDLVDAWLTRQLCRNLVVTVKFKGRDQYGVLSALTPLFERAKPRFARVKQLAHNKNEVTVMTSFR
jgi:23S rRNA U2552 (ribose-2'-O)-methylase RlmE/FtsJ